METTPNSPSSGKSNTAPKIISKNPATGEILAELSPTAIKDLPKIFERARIAQKAWAAFSPRKRAKFLINYKEILLDHADEVSELISKENGKPTIEALTNDIVPSLEILKYFGNKGPKFLKDKTISMENPFLLHRKSYINYRPLGVVTVISPWNFPLMLPFGPIMTALVAGNAVVFKPSEVTPLVGLKIQELADKAGFPNDILQTVIGDGATGAAMIEQKPDKIFFTGSTATGDKITEQATRLGIPVSTELGGKDAMIVLPDANLDFATSAALWGCYGNSGQMCASTERLILHESIADKFLGILKAKANQLKPGIDKDLGTITFDNQKKIYEDHLKDAKAKGLNFVLGGEFNQERTRLQPTIVTGEKVEESKIYIEETFGPTVAATTFKTVSEAIAKANDSKYGLLASVMTDNIPLGEDIAKKLEVGTVLINEVAFTGGVPETPWLGIKKSGNGIKHSSMGLLECVQIRHINKPRFSFLGPMKSLWWYPYTTFQRETFRHMLGTYRKSWIRKLKALPDFLWNFVQFSKKEKRY